MDPASDPELMGLAERLADGSAIDWPEAGSGAPGTDSRLEQLQVLERIITAHRSLPSSDEILAGRTTVRSDLESPLPAMRPGPASWGPMRNLARIGEGSFGEVFRAFDTSLETWVALKLLRESERRDAGDDQRFLAEARRLARVRHPNVVIVHGADKHAGRVGFWSELLKGETLEALLARQGRFSAAEATAIGLDLCRALAAVHAAGVVHRDVKASNVMREEGGRIVLMDLGSGGEMPAQGTVSYEEHVQGTPLAMAPEQLLGGVAGPATDIYGLGALLYRLVSGCHPVEASSLFELLEKHRVGGVVPLRDRRPDLPRDFIQVVERALDPDPSRRFGSAGAMERALERTHGGSASEAGAPRLPEPSTSSPDGLSRRRRPVVLRWALGIAGAVAIAFAVIRLAASVSRSRHPVEALPGAAQSAAQAKPRAAGPLTARAALYQEANGSERRLFPGARISPGTRLSMEIEGPSPMYVYVLDEDRQGNVFVLFPLPGLDLVNPIAPGARVRLPGRLGGNAFDWQVTSSGGSESVIALASREPLADLEREIEGFPRAVPGKPVSFGRTSAATLRTLRGIGGLAGEPPAGASATRSLSQALSNLAARAGSTGDVWVWQMQLENPGR